MEPEQGESHITHPIAIAELGTMTTIISVLDTDDKASAVSLSGHFIDPNRDLNPDTSVMLYPRWGTVSLVV